MKSGLALLVILSAVAATACTVQHKLHITEIGNGVVELYLDEPNDHTLALADQELRWRSVDSAGVATDGTIALVGSIKGGEYVVVWEETGNTTGPATQGYNAFNNQAVLGISVPVGSLGGVDPTHAYAFRLRGHRFVYIFPFFYRYDDVDDEVRFGPNPRPNLGGSFLEDGHLGGNPMDPNTPPVERTTAQGILRGRTLRPSTLPVNGVDVPRDRDREIDWKQDDETFGTPN